VQIDSIQSFLKGPRFVVAATGTLLVIPQKTRYRSAGLTARQRDP
jgi:hypothetical protein